MKKRKFISIKEASKYSSLSTRYLYVLCKKEMIKHFRVGKRIIIDVEDLEIFIEKRVINPRVIAAFENLKNDDYLYNFFHSVLFPTIPKLKLKSVDQEIIKTKIKLFKEKYKEVLNETTRKIKDRKLNY